MLAWPVRGYANAVSSISPVLAQSLIIMSKPAGRPDVGIPAVFVSQKAGIIMRRLMTPGESIAVIVPVRGTCNICSLVGSSPSQHLSDEEEAVVSIAAVKCSNRGLSESRETSAECPVFPNHLEADLSGEILVTSEFCRLTVAASVADRVLNLKACWGFSGEGKLCAASSAYVNHTEWVHACGCGLVVRQVCVRAAVGRGVDQHLHERLLRHHRGRPHAGDLLLHPPPPTAQLPAGARLHAAARRRGRHDGGRAACPAGARRQSGPHLRLAFSLSA